jgi:FHA domain-containing protein/type VI secretion system protein
MPITLSVHRYRDSAPAQPLFRRFDRLGGALGRGAGNELVLDDPTKYISRIHARIEYRDGGYWLVDAGSNPSLVNERPVGSGRLVPLADGDRISIGDYQLVASVEPEAPAAPALPPSPLQLASVPVAAPAPFVNVDDSLADASILNVGGDRYNPAVDPLSLNALGAALPLAAPVTAAAPAYRGAQSDHAAPEQAAFPLPRPAAPVPVANPVPPTRPAAPAAIPEDYDPLADFLPPRVTAPQGAAAPAWPANPAPAAPVQLAPSAPAQAWPATPAPVPFQSAPQAAVPQAEPLAAAAPAHAESEEDPITLDSSFDLPTLVQQPSSAPDRASQAVAPAVTPGPRAHEAMQAAPALSAAPRPNGSAAAAPPANRSATEDPVIQAFLRGLGLPDLATRRSAEEIAELAGAMLREATSGTMEVLLARAMTKRESRLDMTMIASQANNPLKFFPDATSALTQMLNGGMPGYMAPQRAFASAFDDLKAHELAIMAGMRAALAGVLKRFDPQAIEARLQEPSVMDKMLASSRKAKMWDRMVELYVQLAGQADDDFQRLFGEAFGEAYEQQVQRLRQAAR